MIVLDASAVVELLVESPLTKRVESALGRDEWCAPELLDAEVISVIWRSVRSGQLSARAADRAVGSLQAMPLTRVGHGVLSKQVWQLRERVWIFDAFYVACAQAFGATLVTTDARLARAPLPGVSILLVR
jgi:predicted nucleic acid-binding protein